MNRVSYPDIKCNDVLSTCLLSVSNRNQEYVDKLREIADDIATQWIAFDDRCAPKNFHLFKPCLTKRPEQIIAGRVTKKDLKDLYTAYMLKPDSEARKIYDKLRSSSNDICPLCGIYGVDTLDHYLPKARYPLLSVNPQNLLPACAHCNGIKSDSIYERASDQTLYPYDDDQKFYQTDWIKATIEVRNRIIFFDFYPDPPQRWLRFERLRVINHFNTFQLNRKYSINAAQYVSTITSDIRRMLRGGDHVIVQNYYRDLAKEVKHNSTLRVVYNALASDQNICGGNF